MSIIEKVKRVFHLLKIDLVRYPSSDLRRRQNLLLFHSIDKILDVGANTGQYAIEMFKLGYTGKMVSFEPMKGAFKELERKSKKRPNWTVKNYGLGDREEQRLINVSANSFSSSVLEITDKHLQSAPDSRFIRKENISLKTLDAIYQEVVKDRDRVLLKIDAQGFEKQILEGAKNSLKQIKGIQLEMSLEELYEKELLFDEMLHYLKARGFGLCSLENGFYNKKSGKLLQVDGIFFKE